MRLKRHDTINVVCDCILDFVLKKKVLLKDGLVRIPQKNRSGWVKIDCKELAHGIMEANPKSGGREGPQARDPGEPMF